MMVKWILGGIGGALALVLIYIFVIVTRGSVYIVHDSGYQAFEAEEVVHQTDVNGLRKVSVRLLRGDILDMLWVSHCTDKYGGVMVSMIEGAPILSTDFKTHSEQSELKAFKAAMNPLGYEMSENSNGFNGGMREEFRITTVEYKLPSEADKIAKAVEMALDHLEGKSDEFYMTGSLFANGPGGGPGIKFRAPQDPLGEILEN